MKDPEVSGSVRQIDSTPTKQDGMGYHQPLEVSESEKLSNFDAMELDHEQSQPRCSNCENVPCCRFKIEGEAFMIAYDEEKPKTIQEDLSGSTSKEWIKATEEEMNSMKSNQVWDLVDLLLGHKTIGNKWVLNIKRKADGKIDKDKARLVAKRYTQQERIDYEETFSLLVRFVSLRLILVIVAWMNIELYQMDVKTAFLNGELDEEIYMNQLLGFELKGQERKVCNLKRSIYGLKQAPRQWNLKFHQAMLNDGFMMMEEDHCVYIKHSNIGFIIMSLSVDDILIAGNDKKLIDVTKKWLSSNFEMKDMGEASYVLGAKIFRDRLKRLLGLT